MAGLHRSGNSVLSAILNQNPDIYSSPIGPLCEYMWRIYDGMQNYQSSIINPRADRSSHLLGKMIEDYYYDIDKPVIVEREKNWAHPANVNMLKAHLTKSPKIIFTTRPILEILTSFLAIDKDGAMKAMYVNGHNYDGNLSLNENICDFLMSPIGPLKSLLDGFLMSIDNPENKDLIHIVKYTDLVDMPKETMQSIYKFLGLEQFEHDFNNIVQNESYNDVKVGLSNSMHSIRSNIGNNNLKIEDYLTDYTIEKYKDVRYC